MTDRTLTSLLLLLLAASLDALASGATEFCLVGNLDLGVRYQGNEPGPGEQYPTTWCITTEDDSNRVFFSAAGRSNSDIEGAWAVAYLPPDTVRIVDEAAGQVIEFNGTANPDEAMSLRRADPRRLFEEVATTSNDPDGFQVRIRDQRVVQVQTSTELPLRGEVAVEWLWNWEQQNAPVLRLMIDDELLFAASGRWRDVPEDEASALWVNAPGAELINVPGAHWPARVDMRLNSLADDVYIVQGVRSGFQHMVVDTPEGLVVADAPAGWVEFHHIPPVELVPGLGLTGLSQKLVEFLANNFPGRPVKAVAITHFHDDHAGGALAFAAAGADIYAGMQSAGFIQSALNRSLIPGDQTSHVPVKVLAVTDTAEIGSSPNRVKLVSIGPGPHSYDTLGVWSVDKQFFFVSDVHVPRSDAATPRENRAGTECWFARWAVANLPTDVQVINSHSDVATPVALLGRYLESEACSGRSVGH